jgi:hypothetical protein
MPAIFEKTTCFKLAQWGCLLTMVTGINDSDPVTVRLKATRENGEATPTFGYVYAQLS